MAVAGIELTNACPWSCLTCLPASGLARRGEFGTDQMAHVLALVADAGYSGVCFTGGEPLARADFAELARTAHGHGLSVSFFSSGSGLTAAALDALAQAGAEMVISVDGPDAARHDAVRGADSFDVATAALRMVAAAGLRRSLAVTVTRRNADALGQIVTLAREHAVDRITFSEIVRGGRAREHWPELGLSPGERQSLRTSFIEQSAAWVADAAPCQFDDSCWVDGSSLYVTSTGKCYFCSEVGQFRPRNLCGTVSGDWDADRELFRRIGQASLTGCQCRYDMVVRGGYVLVLDSVRPCVGLDYRVEHSRIQ
jgi:MoaA/NifB/PqqE/SkfB family radical SAM enzyme